MHRLVRTSLIAWAALSGAAMAHPPATPASAPAPSGRFFDRMDANRDGTVTRAEVISVLEKEFAGIDTDRDGRISPIEHAAYRQSMRERRFEDRFAAMDGNSDGMLSRAELRAGHGTARTEAHGGKHRDRRGDTYRSDGSNQAETKAEFMQRALTRFNLLDSNDDGRITAAERDAAPRRGRHDRHAAPSSIPKS